MPKTYRKKPLTIKAIQYTNAQDEAVVSKLKQWTGEHAIHNTPSGNPVHMGNFITISDRSTFREAHGWGPEITAAVYDKLHETFVGVKDGDFIIEGLQGEFYPHDAALFPEAYDEVWA
jgi:hypothetical protein